MTSSANWPEEFEQRHARQHHRRHAYQDYDRRLAETREQINRSQYETVNKIASIDIWATERLYKKWQRQALKERHRSMHSPNNATTEAAFNYSTKCQKHCGERSKSGKYFLASMADQINNKRIRTFANFDNRQAGDAMVAQVESQQHRCQRRNRAHSRPDDLRYRQFLQQPFNQEHQLLHEHEHGRRHLSVSNSADPRGPFQCPAKQQPMQECQLERTSDIDDPDGWSSIWGYSPPKRALQRITSERDPTIMNNGSAETNRQETQSTDRWRSQRQSSSRAGPGRNTIEALLTLNTTQPAGNNIAEVQLPEPYKTSRASDRNLPIWHNMPSSSHCADNRTKYRSAGFIACPIDAPSALDERQQQHVNMANRNQRKTELHENQFNFVRLVRAERRPTEEAEKLLKPVLWLLTDQSSGEPEAGSNNDKVNVNNRRWANEATHNQNMPKVDAGSVAVITRKAVVASGAARQQIAPNTCTDNTIARHNSAGSKSLKMLSSGTVERDDEFDIQSRPVGAMRAAQISYIKSTAYCRVIDNCKPDVRVQSNSIPKNTNSTMDSDDSDMIQTAQEVGEYKGIEPKTGTVTRAVQMEVLKAAQIVATRGFAGLIGARPSEVISAGGLKKTKSSASTQEEISGFLTESDIDSISELNDDNDDLDDKYTSDVNDKLDDKTPSWSSSSTEEADKSRSLPRSGRNQKKKLSKTRGDDNRSRSSYGHRKRPKRPVHPVAQPAPIVSPSNNLLPMTHCPTTQHRIECYKTRSGHVKCYMTARHPVKCRVEDGRIVCKSTINPESSQLPYPCNAAWQ